MVKKGDDFGQLLLDTLKTGARQRSIFQYEPHVKQKEFHKSRATGRFFIGGNRSGKTVGGGVEAIYRLDGRHPYQPVPPAPVRGRGVAVDIEDGLKKIMLPEIAKWIPRSLLINGSWEDSYDKQSRTLYCANDSTMDFLTYEQDTEKHAGTSRHFVWFDEEPPKHIYNENALRLVDTGGKYWMTMTPLLGLTWIYEEHYKPIIEEGQENENVAIILVESDSNPHINLATLEMLLQGMSEEEKEARRRGRFIAFAGLIYSNFKEERVIIPALDPSSLRDTLIVAGMDHGFRNPTAWVFGSVDFDGVLTIFHCYYKSLATVDEHAEYVLDYLGRHGLEPSYFVGDPNITQRTGVNGESIHATYAECGVPIALGNNAVNHGIDRVRRYLDEGKLRITADCTELIREFRGYRWAAKPKNSKNDAREAPQKSNDHAMDALRYLVVSRPENDTGRDPEPFDVRHILPNYSKSAPGYLYPAESLEDDGIGDHWILGSDW